MPPPYDCQPTFRVAALACVLVGACDAGPRRPDPDEKAAVFASVAGSYSTGRSAGNSLVIIRPDGQVLPGSIGKDGRASLPRIQEQARAGKRGNVACVITSFGIIAGIAPPDIVNVGRFQYKKAPTSVQ